MMFRDYIREKYSYEQPLELEEGFAFYRIAGEYLNIGELYIRPEFRGRRNFIKFGDAMKSIALKNNCKFMVCQTELTGAKDENSIIAILGYGFKVIGVKEGDAYSHSRIIYQYDLRE